MVLPAGFEVAGIVGLFAAVPVAAVLIAVSGSAIDIIEPDEPPPLPGLVPSWLDRLAQFGWRILIGIGVIALLILIVTAVPLVVMPIILALILAATLEPTVEWLMRRGRTRSRAAAYALCGGTLAVVGMLTLATASLVEQVSELSQSASSGASSADSALGGHLGLLSGAVSSTSTQAAGTILDLADSMATLVTILLLGVLLTFYFLRDGNRLWGGLSPHLPSWAESPVRGVGERAFRLLGGYMIGTGAVSLVGAGSQWLIMVLLGLPLALPIFVISFFLGFIPYIGGFIATLLAFLVAIAYGDSFDVAVMAIWTLVFNIVAGNIVSPLVYERTVHIHPAIVLVAIPAGMAIAGPIGMFLAVPAIGIVAATWRTVVALMDTAQMKKAGLRPPSDTAEPMVTPAAILPA